MGLKCSFLNAFCCLFLLILMPVNANFDDKEATEERQRWRRSAGGGRVGDLCSQNTDCQSGMFCQLGQCQCLSNYVAIASFCWPKVNPGDSGCVEDIQCEGVWPGAKCTRAGICECPEHYVPAKTRDGTVCITSGVPPACPLPEPNNPGEFFYNLCHSKMALEAPSPSTLLANPSTHPLAPDSYMPVLCTSQSTEVTNSNGGDGSTWCIYPDGDKDIYIADLYNCIPHSQVLPEYFPEYSPTVDGICCPSRAFVCIQPMSQGDEPSIPRWWYNSITGTCSQFLWDPTQSEGVSPNNFRTLEHCESYCRDTCRRGSAQFQRHLRATILDELPIANCAHQSGVCAPENGCVQIGSSQQCCPTIASICSPSGGRTSIPLFGSSLFITKDAFDPGAQIAGTSALTRFYYDSEQGRCLNFLYEGGLGNFNNFGTKQDCENFCSKLVCEFGQPLRVAEGQWQRCESSSDCPSAYQCDSGHKVCCPTAQTICTQPKRVGECTGSVSRYWYNAATRQCELFDYTGCQGNDNNFEQLMECQMKCRNIGLEPKCAQGRAHRDLAGHFTRCAPGSPTDGCPPNHECHFDGAIWGCCPTRGWTCSLGPDRGIQCGAGRSVRFHFDADKQSCESFQYEGCDGNANNFQSLEQCQEYCGVGGCPNGGQPLRDSTNNQFLTCSAQQPCPSAGGSGDLDDESHECVLVNAHGTFAHRCCPTKLHICSQPPQPGLACQKRQLTRWYFNIVTRECGKFGFNGCNGNLNNFENQEQCQNFCSSSACAPGELVYRREPLDPQNDDSRFRPSQLSISHRQMVQCEPTLSVSVCPNDFRCVRDQLAHRHVCCGAPSSDVCPPGEKPFWNALDESVRECQANVAGSCPADYLCRLSAAHNKYFCCAPRNGTLCPDGRALYRQPKTLQPLRCVIQNAAIASSISSVQLQNLCPDGFSCQSRLSRDIQGHCCSAQPICKSGAPFFVDERSQQPRQCIPGSFAACPEGFHCERRQQNGRIGGGNGQGVCCKGPPIEGKAGQSWAEEKSDGCPPQESALFLHKQIVQCDPFNPKDKGCPRNYTCQYAKIHQHYQCCAKREILNGTIIGGGLANKRVEENGAEKEEQNEEEENLGCPIGQVAAFDSHSSLRPHSPRPCTVSAPNSCPLGFSCQFSEKNSQFQCCAHRGGCPRPSVAFVDSAGQPQSCSIGKTVSRPLQCPPGFGCQKATDSPNEICCTLEGEKGANIRGGGIFEITLTTSTEGPTLIGQPRERQKPKQKIGHGSRKKCKPNEQWTNGHCRARRLGDACIVAEHCPPTMDCVDYACECPPGYRPKNEWKCELAAEEKKSRHKGKPKDENKNEEENEGNMREKCEHDEIEVDGECLRGHLAIGGRCHRSAQCAWNGAHCVSGRCQCTGGMVAHRNKCHRDVCGGDHYRLPQLGRMSEAITCGDHQTRKCIWPNRCTFSRSLHSYICCHSASSRIGPPAKMVVGLVTMTPAAKAKNGRKRGGGGKRRQQFGRLIKKGGGGDSRCLDGTRPLLFPGSNAPVHCSTPKRHCPANFQCQRQLCCRKRPLRLAVRRLPAISTWRVFAQPAIDIDDYFKMKTADGGG